MSSDSQYFFQFLYDLQADIAESGKKIEELLYNYPDTAISEARKFSELIINDVLQKENYNINELKKFYERVHFLSVKEILTPQIKRSLDIIRTTGNKAIHGTEKYLGVSDALRIYKQCYILADWYASNYSLDLIIPEFIEPRPVKSESINENKIMEAVQAALLKNQSHQALQSEEIQEKVTEEQASPINCNEIENEKAKEYQVSNVAEIPVWGQIARKNNSSSNLLKELKKLQDSSQEAIENADSFSDFKQYMHIERKVQKDVEEVLTLAKEQSGSQIVLLCGSVGDGKSHLLAYLRENKPELLEGYRVINDATESYSPEKNAIETLGEVLSNFSDQNIDSSTERIILAINVGVLHNFLTYNFQELEFGKLKSFIDDSKVFSNIVMENNSDEHMHIVGFTDYKSYELSKKGFSSELFEGIIEHIFRKDKSNPFFRSYLKDLEVSQRLVIHENFEFMSAPIVQKSIVQLVIRSIIEHKLVISTRAFYNFIADILIPELYNKKTEEEISSEFEKFSMMTPNLLFNRPERSPILQQMNVLDPVNIRNEVVDQVIVDANTSLDAEHFTEEYFSDDTVSAEWLKPISEMLMSNDSVATQGDVNRFVKTLIRIQSLINKTFFESVEPDSYRLYQQYLYSYNYGKPDKHLKALFNLIKGSVFKWQGSPQPGLIYVDQSGAKYEVAQHLEIEAYTKHLQRREEEKFYSFKSTLTVSYARKGASKQKSEDIEKVDLEVDYSLFALLYKLNSGYRPNKKDKDDAIKFFEFIDQIMQFGDRTDEIFVQVLGENKKFKLYKDEFNGYSFVKV
ncbi:DNA phosphorothioation-dependent restriction protein DptF [Shouchella shacheensis]|uniref:DNA phosphorothioation-dependent restriction protein DptF n=1 Tax=Shouchella shacheensis TaxID=1649580 RepID=UPI000740444B|nr:DNA phosphorothioation-dependent restriction protein DptF [Shouchella shacheensis]